MKEAINWIKENVLIVVFSVIIILSLSLGWIYSSSFNEIVLEDARSRAGDFSKLNQIARSNESVNVPGGTPIPVSNGNPLDESTVQIVKDAYSHLQEQSSHIHKAALDHNSKNRPHIIQGLFPAPPPSQREVIPHRMHDAIVEAYKQLLASVDAGMPPSMADVQTNLSRREEQVLHNTQDRSSLDQDELDSLTKTLVNQRLNQYQDRASQLMLYADLRSLNVPDALESQLPTLATMYDWQWQYWMTQDILNAIASANSDAKSVMEAPVKRVVSLKFPGAIIPDGSAWEQTGSAGSGRQPSGGGNFAGFGAGSSSPQSGRSGGNAATKATVPNPSQEVKLDYGTSFTGRVTNSLYDVRSIDIVLIVDTRELPKLLDAIAAENFMTVIDVNVRPSSSFRAAQSGFMYGIHPVSQVAMKIETVWLREWMAEDMPEDLRSILGIQLAQGGQGSS